MNLIAVSFGKVFYLRFRASSVSERLLITGSRRTIIFTANNGYSLLLILAMHSKVINEVFEKLKRLK